MTWSAQNRRSSNLGSWRGRALLVLRVVLCALGLQLSGVAGAVEVAAEAWAGTVSECPLEKQGKECPPGCPQCHCPQSNGLAAPASQLALVVSAPAGARVGLEQPVATFVVSPLRSNPYRPPRSV